MAKQAGNWAETVEQYLAEGRSVSGGKGAQKADDQRKQELDMQQKAFDMQKKQLDDLKSAFSKYTTQNIGFDPAQYAAMQTQAMNQNTSTFGSAGNQVRSALLARGSGGGNLPVGGDYVRGISGLMGAQASDLSGNLNSLRIQNAQQALTNRFNAGSLLSGNAATLTGTQGVAGAGASSALGDYIKAKNSGFLQSFASGLGSGLSGGLSAGLTGGIGTAFKGLWPSGGPSTGGV